MAIQSGGIKITGTIGGICFYKLDGKTVSEALGWSSQGFNEKKAVAILSELQEQYVIVLFAVLSRSNAYP